MRRRAGHLLLMLGMLALTGCSSVDKINPFAAAPKDKPAELGAVQGGSEMRVLSSNSVGDAGEFVFTPAVVGERVFAAGRNGRIYRFDNGKQVWRADAGKDISGGVGADGKVVVVGTLKGEVLAFDADSGKPLWQARVSSEVLAAPAVTDGLVAVRSGDSRIFGFDAASGSRRWVYQRSTPALSLRSNVGVTLLDRALIAGFPGGKLVAIATNNGAAIWESTVALPKGATELERVADVASSAVVAGREVCAAAYQGRVTCFDLASGNALWSRDLSSRAGIDVDGRHVYVSDDKGVVHALDRNSGSSAWKQDKLANRRLSRPVALGSLVAVADFEGMVHFLRADDGNIVTRQKTDGSEVLAEPQRMASGVVVQTRKGGIYALGAN
ncbi:outer membrane protein assembly factor BamB [Sulfurisoma sediminicola]|uniref:Outer membrane protein assembly factor BamB n=1 Tax=Sulfurisoma sediminicola TaxID=1381557 RepID=A0A497XA29_9PROT|nr:outer membrane protein assembly factor BamB [Sulfurisoma sediminicola]RLJ62875.1 Beta-barrel assembly machine subunit BamB [Sulfurisoma sediminicola]